MKKYLLTLFVCAAAFQQPSAQLPDGSFAPDFTTTDIGGNEHNLYDYLALGYTVILEMNAAWSVSSWQYHIGEVNATLGEPSLESLWLSQGVDAGGEVMVLMIECDELTTAEHIFGAAGSQGNWTLDITYPIIDDTALGVLYDVQSFPTIYTICPTGIITQTGQLTAEGHWNFLSTSDCQDAIANDVAITAYTGTSDGCGEAELSIQVTNLGVNVITELNILVIGVEPEIYFDWTGTLSQFASMEVELGSAIPVTGEEVVITITNSDDNPNNNSISPSLGSVLSTTHIHLELQTDIYPGDLLLHIYDENGNEVLTGGPWAEYGPALDPMLIEEDYWLPFTGCYTIELEDLYGDGLYDGAYCKAWGVAQEGIAMNLILDIPPSSFFFSSGNAFVNEEVFPSVFEVNYTLPLSVFPNPSCGNFVVELPMTMNETISLVLYDANGKLVFAHRKQPTAGGKIVPDFSSLASGVYNLIVSDGFNCALEKICIKK